MRRFVTSGDAAVVGPVDELVVRQRKGRLELGTFSYFAQTKQENVDDFSPK
ncbi:MAG TPA: hypothetical protein PK163_10080 [Steroidobacteraceae bacterium]|nr:hypothetical protein [Steroidobacteraceae bacterium]